MSHVRVQCCVSVTPQFYRHGDLRELTSGFSIQYKWDGAGAVESAIRHQTGHLVLVEIFLKGLGQNEMLILCKQLIPICPAVQFGHCNIVDTCIWCLALHMDSGDHVHLNCSGAVI